MPTITNRIPTPTFENGIGGWTATAGVTLSTGTAHSLYGTKSLKVTVPAGTGSVRLYPPLADVPDPMHYYSFAFSVAASTAGINYTWGFARLNAAMGNVNTTGWSTNASTTSLVRRDKYNYTISTTIKWLQPYISLSRHATLAVDWYFDGVVWLDEADQRFIPWYTIAPYTSPIVVGGRPDAEGLTFDWAGTVENSLSVATFVPSLSLPSDITRGDTITVTGSGWPPSSTVDILLVDSWSAQGALQETGNEAANDVPTDASGNLSTTLTVSEALMPNPGGLAIGRSAGTWGSYLDVDIGSHPSVIGSTNLFPNPNLTTLNGARPKHVVGGSGDITVTQVDVAGNKRARVVPDAGGSVWVKFAEDGSDLTTYGLVDGTSYLAAVTLHPVAGSSSADPFAYIGEGDMALTGTAPWRVYGRVTGPFAGYVMDISSWDWDGDVELDELMLFEGIQYLSHDNFYQLANTTVDGYALGLRPGRSYIFRGYSYATYTIRTGPSAGSLTDLASWVRANNDGADGGWAGGEFTGVVTIPDGHTVIEFVTTDPDLVTTTSVKGASWWNIYDYVPYFDGDTPDGDGFTYSWAGTPGDSASIRTAAGGTTLDAKVFTEGTAVAVTEMRVVVDGTLIDVTEAGE